MRSQQWWVRVSESPHILPQLGVSGTQYSSDEKVFQENLRLKRVSCAQLSWHMDCVLSPHLKSHSAPFYNLPSSTGRPQCLEPPFPQISCKIPGFRAICCANPGPVICRRLWVGWVAMGCVWGADLRHICSVGMSHQPLKLGSHLLENPQEILWVFIPAVNWELQTGSLSKNF